MRIKFRYIIYIIFFLLYVPIKIIHKDYYNYYQEYQNLLKNYCPSHNFYVNQVIIQPGNLDPVHTSIIGTCFNGKILSSIIIIDKSFWEIASNDQKYQLIMHEMSHCFINKRHIDNPFNYMYPYNDETLTKEVTKNQVINDIKEICK